MSITVSNISGIRNIRVGPAEPTRVGVLMGSDSYDKFNDTIILDSGEIISVGKNGNLESGYSAVIAKFDKEFNKLVTYNAVSDNSIIEFKSVCKDSNNNIYAFGVYQDGDYNGLAMKFDSDLNLLLTKNINSGTDNNGAIESCCIDSNDNIFICGRTGESSNPNLVVSKLNSSLNVQIRKAYGNSLATVNPHDFGYVGKIDDSGYYYVAGRSNMATSSNQYDATLLKFDNNLSLIKQIKLNQSTDSFDEIIGMDFDGLGSMYVVGRTNDYNNSEPWGGFVAKIQLSNLSLLSSKVYFKNDNSSAIFKNIAITSSNIIVSDGSGNIVEIDSNLSIVSKAFIAGISIGDLYSTEEDDIYCTGVYNSKGFVFKTSSITENETINFQPTASIIVETSNTMNSSLGSLSNIGTILTSTTISLPSVNVSYTDEAA